MVVKPDLEAYFSTVTLSRARSLVASHKVVILFRPEINDGVLEGTVKGTAQSPYSVQVFIDEDDLECFCSCPVGYNCKHAAALLMFWMAPEDTVADSAESDSADRRRQQLAEQLGGDQQALSWVDGLVKVLKPASATSRIGSFAPLDDTQCIYELQGVRNASGPTLGVRVLRVGKLKSGLLGKGRLYPLDETYGYYDIDLEKSDELIFDLLRTSMERNGSIAQGSGRGAIALEGTLGAYLIKEMLASGKLYWKDERQVPCSRGADKKPQVHWETTTRGGKKVRISTDLHDNGRLFLAATSPVWFVDPDRNHLGIVESSYSAALLDAVSFAPALPAAAAQALSNLLAVRMQESSLPLPADPSIVFVNDPLVCRLRVYSADGSAQISQWVVQVLMCYGQHHFHVELQPKSRVSSIVLDDGSEVEVSRDHDREYRQYQFFRRRVSGFEPVFARDPKRFTIADHQPLSISDNERFRAFERLFDAFDTLKAEDFEIVVEDPVSLDATEVSDFDFSLQAVDNGWFDLGLQLRHEGKQYNLLPLILSWLQRGDRNTPLNVIAADGRRLSVPASMIRPVAETLLELYDDSKGHVAVTRARAASLTNLGSELSAVGAQSEWSGDKTLLALAEKMERVSVDQQALMKAAKAPRTLKAELRDYQLTGMAWLNFLHEAGFCGVLADDMGLGKTVQTLAHLLSLKQKRKLKGPCLVVAPTSVLYNWSREAQRFAPALKARVWHGAERHDTPLADGESMLVITSYALALRDHALLSGHGFEHLVLDEAQTIKNPSAKVTQALKRMPIEQRICLTGTPLENHLGELWSLFDFLMPGLLGPQKRFSQHFRTPIEKHGDTDRQQRLNTAIAPFLLRRRKHNVAAELPAKTEVIRKIKLDTDQARLYETIRVGMEKRVRALLQEKGVAKSHIQMLDALLKLRQSCCHPELVKLDSARRVKNSAKTDHVLGMIDELVAEGRKILLFSQFTQMLDILERELVKRDIAYVKLTGRTRKRQLAIDAFQNGEVPLFLISLKAGGTGLNLTAADTVIHYDPWWNPAVENQATDRAHRIGQDKPVFVYKLIADNTVEDKIVAMQARKQALADATVERGDGGVVKSLSSEDILSLFAED
ncbi:MAG: SNF2-related protein [Granulosicoccus sp.]